MFWADFVGCTGKSKRAAEDSSTAPETVVKRPKRACSLNSWFAHYINGETVSAYISSAAAEALNEGKNEEDQFQVGWHTMEVDSTSEKGVRIARITRKDQASVLVRTSGFFITNREHIQTAHAGELLPPLWPDPFELRLCLLYRPFFRCYSGTARIHRKQPRRTVCDRWGAT